MFAPVQILGISLREKLSSSCLARVPEPTMLMEANDSVEAFHEAGDPALGLPSLLASYHLTARAVSRFAPFGGRILELGCGTGQFLAHLETARPDLRSVGLDLSDAMLERGNRGLREGGLGDRVQLIRGDITNFRHQAPASLAALVCINTLHQLENASQMEQCLAEIRAVRDATGCGVWLFDFSRPRDHRTISGLISVLSRDHAYPEAFLTDWRQSWGAAFTFEEVRECMHRVGLEGVHLRTSLAPAAQIHYLLPQTSSAPLPAGQWAEPQLSPEVQREANLLRLMFKRLPLEPKA